MAVVENVLHHVSLLARLLVQLLTKSAKDSIRKVEDSLYGCLFVSIEKGGGKKMKLRKRAASLVLSLTMLACSLESPSA